MVSGNILTGLKVSAFTVHFQNQLKLHNFKINKKENI
jgi:hypothetical protein